MHQGDAHCRKITAHPLHPFEGRKNIPPMNNFFDNFEMSIRRPLSAIFPFMLKFSMAPNRILIPLMIALLFIGRGQVLAQTALESGQNPHVTAKQSADVVLSVRFKEGVIPRLRIGDGGSTQVCIPVGDSLNRLFGCQSVKPRFPNSQYVWYAAGSREYFIFLSTDSSFSTARAAYLGIGCFDFILDETQIAGEGGWYGRIKDTRINDPGPARILKVD